MRKIVSVITLLAVLVPTSVEAGGRRGAIEVSVASYNLFLGANLFAARELRSIWALPKFVDRMASQLERVDFRARARALAAIVTRTAPDVLCLQEVALWRAEGGDKKHQDYLAIILAELQRVGAHYTVAVSGENEDVRLPSARRGLLHFVDRNVILVRRGAVTVEASAQGAFKEQRRLSLGRATFSFARGWVRADLKKNGRRFRVINVHLDVARSVKLQQAKEAFALLGHSRAPTIIAGDFNMVPDQNPFFSREIEKHGLTDAYRVIHRTGGATCCNPAHLTNKRSRLSIRVDLLLATQHFESTRAQRVGADASDRASLRGRRLWISDHAGVFADLRLVH